MLTIKQLKVMYEEFIALDITKDIKIEANDRIGVIGANGSGKTTFIKALLGLVDSEKMVNTALADSDMAVHMQYNEYVDIMRIKSIMKAVLTKAAINSDMFNELVEFFDFKEQLNKKYKQLSGGQKQRLTIILVLMQNRKLTFFDEVTTGLDFETRHALMTKIIAWYEKKSASIILVTHYYEELDRLANKLLILDKGKVIDFGDKNALFNKYCGYSVIVYEQSMQHLFSEYEHIIAPEQFSAIICHTKQEEMRIINKLNELEVNFKRTNHDIELVYLNAVKGVNNA